MSDHAWRDFSGPRKTTVQRCVVCLAEARCPHGCGALRWTEDQWRCPECGDEWDDEATFGECGGVADADPREPIRGPSDDGNLRQRRRRPRHPSMERGLLRTVKDARGELANQERELTRARERYVRALDSAQRAGVPYGVLAGEVGVSKAVVVRMVRKMREDAGNG